MNVVKKVLRSRLLRIILVSFAASLASGCSVIQGGRLLAPESFGLEQVTPNIYVESGADEAMRSQLREATNKAENAIRTAYGSVNSHPVVNACITEHCFESFGGRTAIAKVYGNSILLSPRGLNWHFLAHEWSHAELRSRLTFSAWWHLPQWFDEGLAVAISEAPEHSEAYYQSMIASNIPHPTTEELHSLKSLREWLAAVHKYGDDKDVERRAKGEQETHILYAMAGHAVRPWLAKMGKDGLLSMIARLNDGAAFDPAWIDTDTAAVGLR